jgi:hypothetical protein
MRRGHADVDHRHVGRIGADLEQQLVGGAGLADDLEAGFDEEAGQPFADDHRVVGEDDPDRRSVRHRRHSRRVSARARPWR